VIITNDVTEIKNELTTNPARSSVTIGVQPCRARQPVHESDRRDRADKRRRLHGTEAEDHELQGNRE